MSQQKVPHVKALLTIRYCCTISFQYIFDIILNGLMLPVTLQLFEGFGSFRYRFDNIESKHEMVLNSAEQRLYRCFYFEITNNTALTNICARFDHFKIPAEDALDWSARRLTD